jgi:hemerythrin-like domain-containing protein
MNKSLENLMAEHRLIVRVLAALDALVQQLQANAPAARQDLAQFATFFRQFADKCHHGKEEDRLFVKLNEHGFPREYGPVGVMLAEHVAGRAHVRALAEVGQGSGPLTPAEIQAVIEHGGEFVPLLLLHIQKEDHILYPMAQQAIPAEEMARLDVDCEAFEREMMGAGEIQQLKDLAERLIQAFPADPARLQAAMAASGCAGHTCVH